MINLQNKIIGILCGGWSDERTISLSSGKSTYECLKKNNYNVFFLDLKENNKILLSKFVKNNCIDLIFNLIHGTGGEDGLIQSYLDELEIKYVGSKTKASEVSFNKIKTKNIWINNGLTTPDFIILDYGITFDKIVNKLGTNFIVKPIKSGSSVDIEIIKSQSDFDNYISKKKPLCEYFAEYLVMGNEYTAPVIVDEIYPIIKIETKREFYDYNAKYIDEDTIFTFPDFQEKDLSSIEKMIKKAFSVTGCKGWGRVDFFIDEQKKIQLIEVNSIPGMTDHSLVPMSAKKNNVSLIKLLEKIFANHDN